MGFLKKLGRTIFPGTGRGAAKRAERQANQYAQEASRLQADNERKAKRELARINKLSIRGLRSKRAASYFGINSPQDSGSSTIG